MEEESAKARYAAAALLRARTAHMLLRQELREAEDLLAALTHEDLDLMFGGNPVTAEKAVEAAARARAFLKRNKKD